MKIRIVARSLAKIVAFLRAQKKLPILMLCPPSIKFIPSRRRNFFLEVKHMTGEQRKKLDEINKTISPWFEQINMLDERIRHYEQLINEYKCRRAEVKAKLDAWEQTYADTWQEIFDSQEVK